LSPTIGTRDAIRFCCASSLKPKTGVSLGGGYHRETIKSAFSASSFALSISP